MKNISLIALLIMGALSFGYAQDSTGTKSTKQTYSTTTTTNTSTTTDSNSPHFKPFKVGIGAGYAVPGEGDGAGGGLLLYVEPAYRATDRISIGFRLESAIIVRGVKGVNANTNNSDDVIAGDASSNVSYTLNGQYYFTDNNIRPFVGVGLGLFSLASTKFVATSGNTTNSDVDAQTVFGFYPRVGIDIGHFNLTLDYNLIPKSKVPGGGEVVNNYLGIRVGMSIGGGRIK